VPDGVLDLETANRVIENLTDTRSEVDPIQIVDAFDMPVFKYSLDRKVFYPYAYYWCFR